MAAKQPAPARINFEDCAVAFAVDTSGSTSLNNTLRAEQNAVSTIASKLSPSSRSTARLLPWSDEAQRPLVLSQLTNLDPYGGTDPSCLLDDPECRKALQESTMWFLFTDGVIHESSVQQLARNMAAYGLHGTACVVIIFGPANVPPASCNISVGVSVFAVVPDCLFLFHDTTSGKIYLLQCSGRFSQILELHNQTQPILDDNTSWDELPTIKFADLASVSIPAPRALSKDQIALPDGLVLNLKDLFAGRINDEAIIDRIFENDDNLKSIMLTAQTRGEADAFRRWLGPFSDPSSSPLKPQSELEKKAVESIRKILKEMRTGVTDERMQELQINLRQSHADISTSRASSSVVDKQHMSRHHSSSAAIERSSSSTHGARSLSSIISSSRLDSGSANPYAAHPHPDHLDQIPDESLGTDGAPQATLLTPGFRAPTVSTDIFHGKCELCGVEGTNLDLLLRKPPSEQITPGFPEPDTATPLTCPLAVGNFPETDIISSSICCDNCAFMLAKDDETPLGERLLCAIPLVTYAINASAYKTQLKIALQNRLAEDDLPQAFLAIIINTLQRLPSKDARKTLNKALKWCCRDLMSNFECSTSLFSTHAMAKSDHATRPLKTIIAAVLNQSQTTPPVEGLFQYPLPGFIVMILGLHYVQDSPRLPFNLQNQIWQRLLYQITQRYHDYATSQGPLLAQCKLAELLIDKSAAATSPPPTTNTTEDKNSRQNSFRGLRDLFGKSLLFGASDRAISSDNKTTADLDTLVANQLLAQADVVALRSVGDAFTVLERNTKPALCLFLNFLARQHQQQQQQQSKQPKAKLEVVGEKTSAWASAWDRFQALRLASSNGNGRQKGTLAGVFKDPTNITPKLVVEAVRGMAPLLPTE